MAEKKKGLAGAEAAAKIDAMLADLGDDWRGKMLTTIRQWIRTAQEPSRRRPNPLPGRGRSPSLGRVLAYPWPRQVGDLTFRDATPADVDHMLTYRNLPEVNRFMMCTGVDPEEFRREWLTAPQDDRNFSCVVDLGGQAVGMGFLELRDLMGQSDIPPKTAALIGYIIDPAYAGRGIASATAAALVAAAFDDLECRRVYAYCNKDNPASARILEKVHMRREEHGVEDSWHAELGWVDGYGYAILLAEYEDTTLEYPQILDASPSVAPAVVLPEVSGTAWPRRTARFTLRRATPADVPALLDLRNDDETNYWLLRRSLVAADLQAEWFSDDPTRQSALVKDGDRLVGTLFLRVGDGSGQPGGPTERCEAEVGYIVHPDFRGRGVATEIASAGLDIAFRDLGVRRVIAGVYADNTASSRVLEKLGMRREQYGVRDSWHNDLGWVDGATYGLLAREWRGGIWARG